jgi:drug/metabolite transporter (DMT)-like permease
MPDAPALFWGGQANQCRRALAQPKSGAVQETLPQVFGAGLAVLPLTWLSHHVRPPPGKTVGLFYSLIGLFSLGSVIMFDLLQARQ